MPGYPIPDEAKYLIRSLYRHTRSMQQVCNITGYVPSTVFRIVTADKRIKVRPVGRPRKAGAGIG